MFSTPNAELDALITLLSSLRNIQENCDSRAADKQVRDPMVDYIDTILYLHDYEYEKVYDFETDRTKYKRIYTPETKQLILSVFTKSLLAIKKAEFIYDFEDIFVNILEQYYKKYGIKSNSNRKINTLIEEKQVIVPIQSKEAESKEALIEKFLYLVSKAYGKQDLNQLEVTLKQAEEALGSPLGQVYQNFSGSVKFGINPTTLLWNACEADQREIVILLGEAGFDLNNEGLLHCAMHKKNYALVGILAELGADLNRFSVFGSILQIAKTAEATHYFSALGARDDKLIPSSQHWEFYQAGKQFIPEYKAGLILAFSPYIGVKDLQLIIFSYLGSKLSIPMIEEKKSLTDSYQSVGLFGGNVEELIHPEATKVANLILRGEEKEVEEALALVRKSPDLLRYHTIATDPLGRRVKGTLLQIAAMAGDFNLKDGIQEEEKRGVLERLIAAGNLSKAEVADQLDVITGKEAREENDKRNQRVLAAIKKFGKGICEVKSHIVMGFKDFQANCKDHIDQLENDLQAEMNRLNTPCYIFDPKILQETIEWFEDNLQKQKLFCNGYGDASQLQRNVFCVNGIGKLQSMLSSRDAQIVWASMAHFVNYPDYFPSRKLNNSRPRYLDSSSQLGRDFYLDLYGRPGNFSEFMPSMIPSTVWKRYIESKTAALQKLCNVQTVGLSLNIVR